ncbi:MAG: VWA domain-containing protein [Bacteroidia bacterium]
MKKIIMFYGIFLAITSTLFAQGKQVPILDHKDKIRIKELSVLNTPYREVNLSVTPDGTIMYFMSTRGGQAWTTPSIYYKGVQTFDGDIWCSFKSKTGEWQPPRCLSSFINSPSGEDEPNISPDGKRCYYQSWNSYWTITGGPYYVSKLERGKWNTPVGLGGGITKFFLQTGMNATDGMAISPNEKYMILAVGYDYSAPMDLYITRQSMGTWSLLQRLPISTKGDERSAFIAADGKSLYFASDGYGGFGGLDIFKAELKPDGTVGEIVNIGAPFNTPQDDFGFVLTGNGNEAYFVREDDIFYADLSEADEKIKPKVELNIEGTVTDVHEIKDIQNASVTIQSASDNKVVFQGKTDKNGKFNLVIPNKEEKYRISVTAPDYPQSVGEVLEVEEREYSHTYSLYFTVEKPKEEPKPEPAIVKVEPKPKPQPEPKPKPEPKPEPQEIVIDLDKQPEPKPEPAPKPKPKPEPPVVKVEPKPQPKPEPEPAKEPDPYDFKDIAQNHIVMLLDVSASMNGRERLPMLRKAFIQLLTYMRPEDRVSVVAYAGETKVIVEDMSAAEHGKLEKALANLNLGGSTDGKKALKKARELAKKHFIAGGNNRIIMATDADFDINSLRPVAKEIADDKMYLSLFIFGKVTEDKVQDLAVVAEKGNGNLQLVSRENVEQVLLEEVTAIRK